MRPGKAAVSTRTGHVALLGLLARAVLVLVPLLLWPAVADAQLSLARIPLATNDLVYDPHSARVYASIPESEPNGNSVAVIDPATATVVSFIPVGSEPNQLAVSDDGQYLYVGLDDSGSVSVVDLATLTSVQEFSLGLGMFGEPNCAAALAVSPGHGSVVAVAVESSGSITGIRVFDGGVQRGREWTHAGEGVRRLAFLSSGTIVAADTKGRAYTFLLDDVGLKETGAIEGVLSGAGDLRVAGGKVYNAAGSVWDPAAVESATRFEGIESKGPFVVDASRSTAGFLVEGSGSYRLVFYDTRTNLPVTSYRVPQLSFATAGPFHATWCGTGRLAFHDDTQVAIVTLPEQPMHVLRVNRAGTGTGSVTASGADIYCGLKCTDLVTEAAVVDLTPVADEGSSFEGWDGDEDCLDGRVTMAASRSCTANFSSAAATLHLRRLALRGRDIAVLPANGHLLVSLDGSEPEIGNGIIEIDPVTGQATRARWLGGGPGRLALADDGQRLYAAQTWSPGLLDVHLETTETARYVLGRDDSFGARMAADLAVQPGHPDVVAVADILSGVSIWAAGVKRPTTVRADGTLQFGPPNTLYVNGAGLYTLAVGESGVALTAINYYLGLFGSHYLNGLLYGTDGTVDDPVAGTELRKYDLGRFYARGAALHVDAGRIYFLGVTEAADKPVLLTYDLASGRLVSTVIIQTSETYTRWDGPTAFVKAGNGHLAFLTSEALYVVELPPLGTLRTLTLTAPSAAGTVSSSTGLTCTDTCSAQLPEGTTVTLSASAAQGFLFSHWEGDEDCSDGVVTMTGARSCHASFLTRRTPGDLDHDGRSDLVLWNSGLGVWTLTNAAAGTTSRSTCSSCKGSVAVMGDYNANGGSDLSTWRASTGSWYLSGLSRTIAWGSGSVGDIPVPGDYDGDRATDLAVWRPGNGTWYILLSSKAYATTASQKIPWGAKGDKPVPGDYDGDGRTDLAVWRPSTGYWKILLSSKGYASANALSIQWGSSAAKDVLVPADYDGDGRDDLAVWRPSNGTWYVLRSSLYYGRWTVQFGASTDVPSPVDYDGDGKLDPVVWRASTGTWLILKSSSSYATKATVRP